MQAEDTTRSFRPEEIADIVTETVQETEKDLHYLGKVVRMIALLTVQVCSTLDADRNSEIEHMQSRDMQQNAIVRRVVMKLKERR